MCRVARNRCEDCGDRPRPNPARPTRPGFEGHFLAGRMTTRHSLCLRFTVLVLRPDLSRSTGNQNFKRRSSVSGRPRLQLACLNRTYRQVVAPKSHKSAEGAHCAVVFHRQPRARKNLNAIQQLRNRRNGEARALKVQGTTDHLILNQSVRRGQSLSLAS